MSLTFVGLRETHLNDAATLLALYCWCGDTATEARLLR